MLYSFNIKYKESKKINVYKRKKSDEVVEDCNKLKCTFFMIEEWHLLAILYDKSKYIKIIICSVLLKLNTTVIIRRNTHTKVYVMNKFYQKLKK